MDSWWYPPSNVGCDNDWFKHKWNCTLSAWEILFITNFGAQVHQPQRIASCACACIASFVLQTSLQALTWQLWPFLRSFGRRSITLQTGFSSFALFSARYKSSLRVFCAAAQILHSKLLRERYSQLHCEQHRARRRFKHSWFSNNSNLVCKICGC